MSTLENSLNNSEQPAHSLRWYKSRYCGGNESCVETAHRPHTTRRHTIAVRDSAAPATSPVLDFAPHEWKVFLQQVKHGTYDL